MSLQILFAHTGASLGVHAPSFQSLEELKGWIAQEAGVEPAQQILMTARGKQVKIQNLSHEEELFVYDRRLLASSSAKEKPIVPWTSHYTPPVPDAPPTLTIKDPTLHEWQVLFGQRRDWAFHVADSAKRTIDEICRIERERNIMQRAIAIAVSNVNQHTTNLKPKFEQTREWADQILTDQHYLLQNWRGAISKYRAIPARAELGRCVNTGITFSLVSKQETKLIDLIDPLRVKEAAEMGEGKHDRFSGRMTELVTAYREIEHGSRKVIDDFHDSTTLSRSQVAYRTNQLIEEVEVLSRKMEADCDTIWNLPNTPKALTQASRTAYLHDNTFMTSLTQASEEVNALFTQVCNLRNEATQASLQHLQQISTVESNISSIHLVLAQFDLDRESAQVFEVLNAAVRLPFIYGSIMIECLKRSEWTEKMTADSSLIAEEMATYKAEEAKRRQKWAKDYGAAIDLSSLDAMTLGIEVNIQSQKDNWPKVTRKEVEDYLVTLESLGGFEEVINELKELVKSLDAVTKQQAKRAKAFKNGSVHEATFGPASLLLRGDDETLRSLKKDKIRAEDRLKSAESRIRKLEDLLHRQSQSSRPPSLTGLGISGGPSFERHASSPVPNLTSALTRARESEPIQNSTVSHRLSINQGPETRSLAERIVNLEAELIAERAQSKELEKASAARENAQEMLQEQIREAISTKEDLLSNFEAQQCEFDDERRLLNDQNKKLKVRLEELEDEVDRLYGNHDLEYKIHGLEEDLDTARKEATSEIQKAHEQTEALQKEYIGQREECDQLRQELKRLSEEKQNLQATALEYSSQLKHRNRSDIDHQSVLLSALLRISQDAVPPDDFNTLIHTLGSAVEGCVSQQMVLERSLQSSRTEKESLEIQLKSQIDENHVLLERTKQEEAVSEHLRDQLDKKSTHGANLQSQLLSFDEERVSMQSRLDTSSAATEQLQRSLEGRDRSIETLKIDMQEAEGRHQELVAKLEERRSELASLQGSYVRLKSSRDLQSSRTDEVSGQLHFQTSKLRRLLEQLGFSISRQDGSMLIQRASKTTSSSTTLPDPSASMKRSISGQILTKEEAESAIDTKVLHWAKAEGPDESSGLYEEFSSAISSFDIDAFHEAIYKRVKEIEHIARKSQRDARSYRDKAQRAQSEAHERLALRGFKEGDLALFLPTRDQATKPWAAFNVGAPHFFLREQESHKLNKRDWLIARISKVEERVVDLSRSISGVKDIKEDNASFEDENPYELSDGLRWYLLDAAEEKPGAPINVGLGKTTVASVNVDAKGTVRIKKSSDGNGATKTLTRSLDSRRSSANSRKGLVAVASNSVAGPTSAETAGEQSVSNVALADTVQAETGGELEAPIQDGPDPPEEKHEQVGATSIPPSPREWS